MAVVLGFEGKLYYGSAGGTADTELDNVTDVNITLEDDEADVSTRADAGEKATVPTTRSREIEFTMIKKTTDANYIAMQNAYINRTPLAIKMLDYAGGPGWQTDMSIFSFSDAQPLNEAQTISVTMKRTAGAALTVITV